MSPGQIPPSLYFTGITFLYIFCGISAVFESIKFKVLAHPIKSIQMSANIPIDKILL